MLVRAWQRWKQFARVVATFQARVLLTVFYFVVVAPFGLGVHFFSDPLRLRRRGETAWLERGPQPSDAGSAQRQS